MSAMQNKSRPSKSVPLCRRIYRWDRYLRGCSCWGWVQRSDPGGHTLVRGDRACGRVHCATLRVVLSGGLGTWTVVHIVTIGEGCEGKPCSICRHLKCVLIPRKMSGEAWLFHFDGVWRVIFAVLLLLLIGLTVGNVRVMYGGRCSSCVRMVAHVSCTCRGSSVAGRSWSVRSCSGLGSSTRSTGLGHSLGVVPRQWNSSCTRWPRVGRQPQKGTTWGYWGCMEVEGVNHYPYHQHCDCCYVSTDPTHCLPPQSCPWDPGHPGCWSLLDVPDLQKHEKPKL